MLVEMEKRRGAEEQSRDLKGKHEKRVSEED